jgi:hypothetical protein
MASSEETFEQVAPSPDALRPFVGKVVAFDDQGIIRESATSWGELVQKLKTTGLFGKLALLYVPAVSIAG